MHIKTIIREQLTLLLTEITGVQVVNTALFDLDEDDFPYASLLMGDTRIDDESELGIPFIQERTTSIDFRFALLGLDKYVELEDLLVLIEPALNNFTATNKNVEYIKVISENTEEEVDGDLAYTMCELNLVVKYRNYSNDVESFIEVYWNKNNKKEKLWMEWI